MEQNRIIKLLSRLEIVTLIAIVSFFCLIMLGDKSDIFIFVITWFLILSFLLFPYLVVLKHQTSKSVAKFQIMIIRSLTAVYLIFLFMCALAGFITFLGWGYFRGTQYEFSNTLINVLITAVIFACLLAVMKIRNTIKKKWSVA